MNLVPIHLALDKGFSDLAFGGHWGGCDATEAQALM